MNPVWNERIRIPAPNGKIPDHLSIRIKTGRVLSSNEALGNVDISLIDLSATNPLPQQAYPVTEGEGVNPQTEIWVAVSYDPNARPWEMQKKSKLSSAASLSYKKLTQGTSQSRKNVLREITKWLVISTRLGTDGYKDRKWVGGVVGSCQIGLIRLSVYSTGELIVPDAVIEAEKENSFTKTVKKGISKIYDVLEIACLEVQRQKQEGSIGMGLILSVPGIPMTVSMTMIFDIVTSYVVSRGLAYLNAAGARVIFDGII